MPDEKDIFHAARRLPAPAERGAYLDDACGGDAALRGRLDALLAALDGDTEFLHSPVFAVAPDDIPAGTVIGPYRIGPKLGEGGMGTVYLAEQDEPIRRQVAIKLIKPGLDSRQVLRRFEAERQALALMDHPNIAKILDAGLAGDRPYFVMELVRGVPITTYADERRLSPRQRLELFVPVCRAVQHAHQKGVIHRDLKPSNVLVAEVEGRPVPKVIDFGVAKAADARLNDESLETAFGAIIGTPEYMSPEQAEPGQPDVDTRSDVYSLGVMLYELLTGSTPLQRKRLQKAAWLELLRVIREEEPPKPSTRLSGSDELHSVAANRGVEPRRLTSLVRGDLDWIVMKSLDKDRARRYETANGLARDVERFLNDEPVEACPPSAAYRVRKFARRHRVGLITASAFALLLAAAAAVSTWQAIRVRAERDHAVAERLRADQEAATANAVSEFLRRDLLEQADIANQQAGVERNPTITVRELLDRAGKAIEGKFANQPRTEAALRQTLGDAYRALGEYPAAERHLRRALDLTRQVGSERRAEAVENTKLLADVLYAEGNYPEAEKLYREALDACQAELGNEHANTLAVVSGLGLLHVAQGRYAEAEELLQRAVDGRTAKLGSDDLKTLESLGGLAVLNYAQRRYDKAALLFRQMRDGFHARLGPDHPSTMAAAGSLAACFMGLKRFDEAAKFLNEIVAVKRKKLGVDHPETCDSMQNLAQVYQELKRFDESEALYREALEARRRKQGPDHRDTLRLMQNFATYHADRGQYDQAEALYKSALSVQREKLGADHPEVVMVLNNLGVLCRRRGWLEEAVGYFDDALAIARPKLTLKHDDAQEIIVNLCTVHYQLGRPERAEALAREFVAVAEGTDPPTQAFALGNLALNLLAQKKHAEAEAVARRCLDIRAKLAPGRWSYFLTRSLLGGALAGQGKHAEAEPHLVEGFEGLKRREAAIPAPNRFHVNDSLQRVVQLYEAWGKPAEAAKWRRQLPAGQP